MPAPGSAAAFGDARLGSISRTFSFNDPQADVGDVGQAADRNVELLVADPR